jgi:hypothetical protein
MSETETRDGRAFQRPPVQRMSQSVTRQPRLATRLAHTRRDVRDRVRSIGHLARPRSASGLLAAVAAAGPSAMPSRANLVVVTGLFLGVWAIFVRRTVLGLGLILLALAIAGAVALSQEGHYILHSPHTQATVIRSRMA